MVRSVRAAPKLFGHRGARPVDVAALEDVMARVSCLADDLPELAELALNPVSLHEHGAAVLGVVVRLPPRVAGWTPAAASCPPPGQRRERPGPPRGGSAVDGHARPRGRGDRMGECESDTARRRHRPVRAAGRLVADVERAGYYPALVSDVLDVAVAGEEVRSYLVHQETTFDRDEVRRHVTVLVLTPTRLVVAHADDHEPDALSPEPYASASTEAVPLRQVRSVVLSHAVTRPEQHRAGATPRELILTIGWGSLSRIDLEPAGCGDPDCEADHGYYRHGGRRRHHRPVVRRRRGRGGRAGRGRLRPGRCPRPPPTG